ncbi:hypothetical protein DVH05_026332 [Phytophthora capsici]|nr:hypothetical protein DVH05_026332 [Phytophthora capsici]
MQAPDREVVAKWIAQSWKSLSADTIAHGFKKANLRWDVEPSVRAGLSDVVHDDHDRAANSIIAELAVLHALDEKLGDIDSGVDICNTADDDTESSC